ncbi:MAG: cell division protein FtsB [Gammaproteobacteria bacterium]|nr:cell division protein FtsB [Gammaproteobacteria bacterium]
MKPLKFLLTLVFCGLQYALWFGDKNVFDLYRLNQTGHALTAENDAARKRNANLREEVIDLKKGGETAETLARSELGLIKEGETFYQIIE